MKQQDNKAIRCDCGKLLAIVRQGKVYIKCKGCKREIEIGTEPRAKSQEP